MSSDSATESAPVAVAPPSNSATENQSDSPTKTVVVLGCMINYIPKPGYRAMCHYQKMHDDLMEDYQSEMVKKGELREECTKMRREVYFNSYTIKQLELQLAAEKEKNAILTAQLAEKDGK